MALTGFRDGNIEYAIDHFMNTAGTRGGVVSFLSTSAASGAAMDMGTSVVGYNAAGSGSKPAGLLLNDVVDVDQTRYHRNMQKDEVVKGGKVTLATKGRFETNFLEAGTTPSYGAAAYLSNSGLLTPTLGAGGLVHTPKVGRFLGSKNEDGYVKVEILLT